MRKRHDRKVKKVAAEQWSSGDVGRATMGGRMSGMGCASSGRLGGLERAVAVRWSGVAGLMGCVGLLVLLLAMLVTPVVPGRVYAEEKNVGRGEDAVSNSGKAGSSGNIGDGNDINGNEDRGFEKSDRGSDGTIDDDSGDTKNDALDGGSEDKAQASAEVGDAGDEIATTAAYVDSTITLSLGMAALSEKVAPSSTTGGKARVSTQATVRVQNSGGYTVYIGSTSSQLKNGNYAIDTVTANTTYANLPVNRWGYSANQGTTVKDSYSAMPATKQGAAIYTNSSTNIADSGNITFTLGFAANIGGDKPTGTYTNSVTVSVVSEPKLVGLMTLTNMQDMTSAICTASDTNESKQLKDTRDGKFYWVTKLADGKCWMTQNLDLDLSTATTLTNTNTDLQGTVTSYKPAYTTATTASSSTILNEATGQRSWSLGNYRITSPTAANSCGYPKNSAADCPEQFTAYTTPTSANGEVNAHYALGNFYQWNTATAGTGGTITSGTASSSICPKNWRLPTSTSSGEFQALITAGAIGTSVAKLTSSPYYFVRGGYVLQSASYLFGYAGLYGGYWSSTPGSTAAAAYRLAFAGTSGIDSSSSNNRQDAFSIRCIAR